MSEAWMLRVARITWPANIKYLICRHRPQSPDDNSIVIRVSTDLDIRTTLATSAASGHVVVYNIMMPVNAVAENVFGTMGQSS